VFAGIWIATGEAKTNWSAVRIAIDTKMSSQFYETVCLEIAGRCADRCRCKRSVVAALLIFSACCSSSDQQACRSKAMGMRSLTFEKAFI